MLIVTSTFSLKRPDRGFLAGTFQRQYQMSHSEQPHILLPTLESDGALGTRTWALNGGDSHKYQSGPSSVLASAVEECGLQNLNTLSGNKKLRISC